MSGRDTAHLLNLCFSVILQCTQVFVHALIFFSILKSKLYKPWIIGRCYKKENKSNVWMKKHVDKMGLWIVHMAQSAVVLLSNIIWMMILCQLSFFCLSSLVSGILSAQSQISPLIFQWIAVTFGTDVHVPLRMNPKYVHDPLTFYQALPEVQCLLFFQWNISRSTWCIGTTFSSDVHVPQRMNPNDLVDFPTFSSSATIRFTTSEHLWKTLDGLWLQFANFSMLTH